MSEAPKRVWARPADATAKSFDNNLTGRWSVHKGYASGPVEEYVRADLLAAVEAERDALREAVREAEAAFDLYAAYVATATDRGGRHGPKGQAARKWEDAVAAWLAKHGGQDG